MLCATVRYAGSFFTSGDEEGEEPLNMFSPTASFLLNQKPSSMCAPSVLGTWMSTGYRRVVFAMAPSPPSGIPALPARKVEHTGGGNVTAARGHGGARPARARSARARTLQVQHP